ncbi:chloride channel protein [Synechococcus sp. H60.3]|uniref:chloride channel protein n=1 Tax=Synechococcus sp. H60.3 TaxID=2967124 RepID=UPI0039C367C0
MDSVSVADPRLRLSSENLLLLLAAAAGLGTGLLVVGFRYLIGWCRYLLQDTLVDSIVRAAQQHGLLLLGSWATILAPLLGGLLIGTLGVVLPFPNLSLSSLVSSNRPLAPRPEWIPLKLVAAAISLGAGASLGPEAPSVESGALLGCLLGQNLRLSRERVQLLMAAGAAAGLAAGFNAPIAGVFLALELALARSFTTSAVSVVVLAAVVSALIAQVGLGAQPAFLLPTITQPAFVLPAYELHSLLEVPLYLGLGLLASLVSIAFGYALEWGKHLFGSGLLAAWPAWSKPILGGGILGCVGLGIPLALGVGYETIELILQAVPFSLGQLGLLLLGKLFLSAVSLGSGFVGGTFAPALFLGAVLGAGYGQVLGKALPAIALSPPAAYAMVGMGAVLAASVRAPLTAILLLFEMTRDYHIALPVMAAVGLSIWLTEQLHPPAIYPSARRRQEPKGLTVQEVMVPPSLLLQQDTPLREALERLLQQKCHSALVVDGQERLRGILTLEDLERALAHREAGELAELTVEQVSQAPVLTTFPDEAVAVAAEPMYEYDLRQLPVVSREDPEHVVGLLDRERVLLSQEIESMRQVLEPEVLAPDGGKNGIPAQPTPSSPTPAD